VSKSAHAATLPVWNALMQAADAPIWEACEKVANILALAKIEEHVHVVIVFDQCGCHLTIEHENSAFGVDFCHELDQRDQPQE
jgi:hypothetical protein